MYIHVHQCLFTLCMNYNIHIRLPMLLHVYMSVRPLHVQQHVHVYMSCMFITHSSLNQGSLSHRVSVMTTGIPFRTRNNFQQVNTSYSIVLYYTVIVTV